MRCVEPSLPALPRFGRRLAALALGQTLKITSDWRGTWRPHRWGPGRFTRRPAGCTRRRWADRTHGRNPGWPGGQRPRKFPPTRFDYRERKLCLLRDLCVGKALLKQRQQHHAVVGLRASDP